MSGWLFAVLSPFGWGVMNVLDKYIVMRKIRSVRAFSSMNGLAGILVGGVLAAFLDWQNATLTMLLFPVLAGILLGVQEFVYYFILKEEDVSHVVGLAYVYPILVAIASFLVLGERLSWASIAGMALAVSGAVLLCVRLKHIRLRTRASLLVALVILAAAYDFAIKLSVMNLPELHAVAVDLIAAGVVVGLPLCTRRTRAEVRASLGRSAWIAAVMAAYGAAVLASYFAMGALPAAIVSSVAALQPLVVLVLERVSGVFGARITRDAMLLPKLVPICVIVAGVALMYVASA